MPVFVKGDKRVLFVHVPKTGGSTVERVFRDSGWSTYLRTTLKTEPELFPLRRCSPQHLHAAPLRQLLRVGSFDLVLMLVRDPLARFRSEYTHGLTDTSRLEETAVEEWADRMFARYRRNPFVRDNHLRPQWEFLLPGAEVHRLEGGLEQVLRDLDSRHGLGLVEEVPHAMDRRAKSGFSSAEVPLSRSLEQRVREWYAEDFRRFGY